MMRHRVMRTRGHQVSAIEIPGYHIERELGRGGMAVVYLATQTLLERQVALKVLQGNQVDAAWRARFLREGRLVAKLCHRHIVTIYDFGLTADLPYLAMEYLPGGDLHAVCGQGTVQQRVQWISQLAQALACAHRQQMIHRDLKPQNILFRADGEAVLTDFGIAKQQGDGSLTRSGTVVGTAAYLSPEQGRGLKVDPRSDLYSLGVVLYELLTGQRLFIAETELGLIIQHMTQKPPPLPAEFASLQPILDKLLAKPVAERYPDAETLLVDLTAWLTPSLTPSAPDNRPSAAVAPSTRLPPNLPTAWMAMGAQAAQGLAAAQRQLGLAYFHGQGLTQDYAQARHWLEQAAAQHDAEALYYLARLYEHQLGGTPQSDAQALRYYHEAAQRGYFAAYADYERLSGSSF